MGKDYYAILGISRNADDETIKKAYRKSALKWHPDRNKDKPDIAKAKFQEISEAYEVLNDKNKRAIFDQYGEEGLKAGPLPPPPPPKNATRPGYPNQPKDRPRSFPSGGFKFSTHHTGFRPSNADDIFTQFFSSQGMGGRGGFQAPAAKRSKPPAIRRPLPISLEDLYGGTIKRLKVTRRLRDGLTGVLKATDKILTIQIKPGWKAGTKIRFPNEGDELEDGQQQDIEFVVEEKSHPVYKREGDQLRLTIELSLVDALTGFQKTIKTLDGRSLSIKNANSVIKPGHESWVANEGMPNSKTGKKGDLIITYDVQFPSSLTEYQKEQIKKAFA